MQFSGPSWHHSTLGPHKAFPSFRDTVLPRFHGEHRADDPSCIDQPSHSIQFRVEPWTTYFAIPTRRYYFPLADSEVHGACQIFVRRAEDFELIAGVHAAMADAGLKMDDTVLEIDRFYPNGTSALQTQFQRAGRGTAALQQIYRDAREISARAVYSHTRSSSFRSFLLKHGFNEASQFEFVKIVPGS